MNRFLGKMNNKFWGKMNNILLTNYKGNFIKK